MKIYFSAPIRGDRSDVIIYKDIIDYLKKYGEVLTEHVGNETINQSGEIYISDEEIHNRDMEWLLKSDLIIADVTNLSLGVGYELGRAVENKKKIVCIYRNEDKNKRLSAMIGGSRDINLIVSNEISVIKSKLKKYLSK